MISTAEKPDIFQKDFRGKKVLVVGFDPDACEEFKAQGAEVWMVASRDLSKGATIADHFIKSKIEDFSPVGLEGTFSLIFNRIVDQEIKPTQWSAVMDLFKTLLKRDGEVVQVCIPVMDEVTTAYQSAFQNVTVYSNNRLHSEIHARTPLVRRIGHDTANASHGLPSM